ncbi:protein kinase domain-containing protein [Pseudonocardia humida]|uniref:Protein kinase n=1 Tax=Pseudonocardia humida TaxID=2800819 RepID=A0ABT1A998_9PSEU|nr:protein kinase [Pseudonocardia humida]MCO1659605.1 protein kinase [Pseudonocardia humida]
MLPREFGHYRLDVLLGTGGMGEVYLAHDSRHERDVALKLLPEILANDPEYTNRFRRESRVAARLREPHVIPIHDFGEIDGRLYIDMRLVDGTDLGKLLQDGPMDAARAVTLIGQVADALDAAHDDGLVHRDVKPSNILLTRNDFVYVVDFGIARSIGTAGTSLTMTGAAVGTLDYMAPERFTMSGIDRRTDVYSLSCLLHECLTATRPFKGSDLPALMYAHLFNEPPRPSEMVPGLPPALDDVISRGMAKQPEDRFATAGELAAAAREAVLGAGSNTGSAAVATASRAAATGSSAGALAATPVGTPAAHSPDGEGPTAVVARSNGHDDRTEVVRPGALVAGYGHPDSGTPPPVDDHRNGATPPPLPPAPSPAPKRRSSSLLAAAAVLVLALAALAVIWFRPFGDPATGGTTATAPDRTSASQSTQPEPPVETSAPPVPVAASIAVPTVGDAIPVGPTPGYMHMAPNGRFAYIANRDAGIVTVLDTTINKVTATIPIPQGPPQFVAFSPRGERAYISVFNSDYTLNLVVFVDTGTNTVTGDVPVGKRPFASATTPDGRLLYVPSHDDGRLDVIDTETATLVKEIPVAPNPHWVAFGKDGRSIYTANHESGVVTVLDASNDAIVKEIDVGVSPHSTTVSPDGSRVSVVNYDSSEVSVIDTATHEVVATIPVDKKPQDIAYAPDGRFFYTTNVEADTVDVINAETNQITARINTGDGPTSIAVMPNGKRAYVTNLNDGTVRILDIAAVS